MAIIRRLPWPELLLLFVGVWLCLALEPNDAARLPSDRLVFPSESQPKLESRLKEIEREFAVVSRLMNATDESLLMMQLEAKNDDNSTRISTGSEKPPATTTGRGKAEITSQHPASESRVITFGSDPESNSQRPWEETEILTTIRTMLVLEPRITLETLPKCPEGYISSEGHCRKQA